MTDEYEKQLQAGHVSLSEFEHEAQARIDETINELNRLLAISGFTSYTIAPVTIHFTSKGVEIESTTVIPITRG